MTRALAYALLSLGLACLCGSAQAQHPAAGIEAYALFVGSNEGGAGQNTLGYAEQDAMRMAGLFAELGRIPRHHIRVLQKPNSFDVERSLHDLYVELAALARQGRQTQLLFYYSGHARADALSLGKDELPLSRLRALLSALPSTLTVVVLDACQSGAFSGVKGAAPAADFSTSSTDQLVQQGIAVLASSTGSELSQESPELRGSYFTHHLMVALRGAGDGDGNGRVSLDEAYRYAYDHTLSDTARTQVGSQHATLETELKGRGDVPLTYPRDADAQLLLPAQLSGRVLVQLGNRGAVMAELVKVPGAALQLALPSSDYVVLLRANEQTLHARECFLRLYRGQVVSLAPELCREIKLPAPRPKGDERSFETWFVEIGVSASGQLRDDYIKTLNQQRYVQSDDDNNEDISMFGSAALGFGLLRNLSILGRVDGFERRTYRRIAPLAQGELGHYKFQWRTRTLMLGLRGRWPLVDEYVVAYAEIAAGMGITRSVYNFRDIEDVQRHVGPAVRGTIGFAFGFIDNFGAYVEGGYATVRSLDNLLGDTHDDGGYVASVGLRLKALQGWW